MQGHYRKHFVPLESTPDIFNQLIVSLGARPCLSFQDVLSINEPSWFPHPAIALILIFPTTEQYENRKAAEDANYQSSNSSDEQIVWFPQTINNACGLYGVLHALSNGAGRSHLKSDSWLARLLAVSAQMSPDERSLLVENSKELEEAYAQVATQGSSSPPDNPEDEVDFHYICLVRSYHNGHLYELDGDRKGPIDRGDVLGSEEDLLGEGALAVIREYFRDAQEDIVFSLMALVVEEDAL